MCTASGPAIERNKHPSEMSSTPGFYAPDAHSSPPPPLPPPPRQPWRRHSPVRSAQHLPYPPPQEM